MPENFALYSRTYDALPDDQMQVLADAISPQSGMTERGLTYSYRWPDLTILVSVMAPLELAEHLRGFEGYIRRGIYTGNVPARGERIIRRIRETRLVVGVELDPERDQQDRADQLVGRMAGGLHPIIFHGDELFDWMSRLLLARNGSFDPEAEID